MTPIEQRERWETARIPAWMPSDTEESIVGTEWHQEAIGSLATMLRIVADRRGASWGVGEQHGAHHAGNPGIYAGEHVTARPAAGFNPLWPRPGGLKPTARPDMTYSPP